MGLFDFWKKKSPKSASSSKAPQLQNRQQKNLQQKSPWARRSTYNHGHNHGHNHNNAAPQIEFGDELSSERLSSDGLPPLAAKQTAKIIATTPLVQSASPLSTIAGPDVRRHFYNEAGFQTYASFFQYWEGWITAGHCLSEAAELIPDFADGDVICHPDGLDAALIGCTLPQNCPAAPFPGQEIICIGYPAGCRTAEIRRGKVYMQRPNAPSWIAHIIDPDEPVVTGMSGGAVIDAASGTPIGIIITRNSPADLNNDRDPDESCDFTALTDVWTAVQ